jgi:hypothetical protein
VLDDALVEALEAGREKRQLLLVRELFDQPLIQLASLGRQRDHPVLGEAAVSRVERCSGDVDAQDHARAAAVGVVVDLTGLERRRVAVVEQAELERRAEHGCERTLLGEPGKRVWDEREDIDAQSD